MYSALHTEDSEGLGGDLSMPFGTESFFLRVTLSCLEQSFVSLPRGLVSLFIPDLHP